MVPTAFAASLPQALQAGFQRLDPAAFGGATVLIAGVAVNIKGNKLPQAPNFKFSVGAQYTAEFDSGMSLVPRVDLTYTGDSYGNIFNGRVNKVDGYSQINAQIQLNGRDDQWFARAFLQNTDEQQLRRLVYT